MLVEVAPGSQEVSLLTPSCVAGDKGLRNLLTTRPSSEALIGHSSMKNMLPWPEQMYKIGGLKKDFISGDREERAAKRQA